MLEKTGLPGKVKALANLAGWCYLWNFGVMLIMFNMMGSIFYIFYVSYDLTNSTEWCYLFGT